MSAASTEIERTNYFFNGDRGREELLAEPAHACVSCGSCAYGCGACGNCQTWSCGSPGKCDTFSHQLTYWWNYVRVDVDTQAQLSLQAWQDMVTSPFVEATLGDGYRQIMETPSHGHG